MTTDQNSNPAAPCEGRWELPPLAAVTGVVRLRNRGELPVRRHCNGELTAVDGPPRWWLPHGGYHSGGRHEQDIVEQVSVGPTGPGVYQTNVAPVHLPDERRSGGLEWDDFGRAFSAHGARCEVYDLRLRIGDLPPEPAPVPPAPSYPASEGRAAMEAMWVDGVPTVDARFRLWLREMLREVVAADVAANCRGVVITASPEGFCLSEDDLVPVDRDDSRVLWKLACVAFTWEQPILEYQPAYSALRRTAAALGETLPAWMTDYAKREGWE